MEKPTYKLVGQPCGHHGQYTFYKALRLSGAKTKERILAIGDFFFVRIWQDSELVSIGELQLLWRDRVSEQTLVSLRLYFLPENTPDGRGAQGEHEVLAINDKVVMKAEDLQTWTCDGRAWSCGMRAVWRGACAPPADDRETEPLHHTKLDFSDVDSEKTTIVVDPDDAGVVVFSYPRYCRYRAAAARLEGLQADWLRDSLVAALGGYAAPTKNTRIMYCKETFEYPELEGHEFVCNHLAPKLKGRGRGRRRRQQRSRTQSPESRSSDDDKDGRDFTATPPPPGPRRLSLRNAVDKTSGSGDEKYLPPEERHFLRRLRHFYKENDSLPKALALKHISLNSVYSIVTSRGGYDAVCRQKLWRVLFTDQPVHTRRHYERYLLAFEHHERRFGIKVNGMPESADTGHVMRSPLRDDRRYKHHVDCETGEIKEVTTNADIKPEVIELPPSPTDRQTPAIVTDQEIQQWADLKGVGSLPPLAPLPAPHPPSLVNGHSNTNGVPLEQKPHRPAGRSSLRAVRVKPARQHAQPATAPNTPPTSYPLLSESLSTSPPLPPHSAPPVTNFGIHHPPPPPAAAASVARTDAASDDEIVEVPYKPKTPEIIDLDEYPETESPDASKRKRLDILKERGLEVTPLPTPWPTPVTPVLTPNPLLLNPAMQQQLMASQLYGFYNPPVVVAPYPNIPNGIQPPRVIQATSIFGSSSPEKTVYGNPKDPFMPPPHVLHGVPIKPHKVQVPSVSNQPQDILDLTCKLTKPAVEIVRVPTAPSPSKPQNIPKNYSIVDGKAVVGSNLEITLVNKSQTPPKKDARPQKRSSNGKFLAKTPTPPKDTKNQKKPAIVVPSYQVRDDPSPTGSSHSASSRDSQKEPQKSTPMSFLDPYMALYSLAGHVDPRQVMGGQIDPRQVAAYREAMVNQFRGYSNLLNLGVANPTNNN